MKKKYLLFFLLLILMSCNGSWDVDGVDFRNYLRDKHPYAELIEIDLNIMFAYQVNDTLNDRILIYTSWRDKDSVRSIRIKNCIQH
jgi:hypothetical protein